MWVKESYSVRQLSGISGHSAAKIKRIKNYWLTQTPEDNFDSRNCRYLLFDGTYFHRHGCLIMAMDAPSGKVVISRYVDKERYSSAFAMFECLKRSGVEPRAITLDGHLPVMRAVRAAWPDVKIQRCLFHIQREGMRWLRSKPKTKAGMELRILLSALANVKTGCERDEFLDAYDRWLGEYADFVRRLPLTSVAHKDLKKTMALINNARTNMFHFISDGNIESSTNKLEGFHSRLKADYRRHRGLSAKHREAFLRWYCHFENSKSSNTF